MVRSKFVIIGASISILAVIVVYRSTDSEAVKTCQTNLEGSLKSPSSLKIVKTVSLTTNVEVVEARTKYILPKLLSEEKLTNKKTRSVPLYEVSFTYDADNSYGAALRGYHNCTMVAGERVGLTLVEPNIKKDPKIYQLSLEEQFKASLKALEASRRALEE
jgi:hypothetical protein